MHILPGLTSTDKSAIKPFIAELKASKVREIACFPTCLEPAERAALFAELESVPGLRIPHVHLRSEMGHEEIAYLAGRFGTEVFNVHAGRSSHPYSVDPGAFRGRIFIENSDAPPGREDLAGWGGVCVDYAHWEAARLEGKAGYEGFEGLLGDCVIGCCHISAVRPGIRSPWGGFDHHRFESLEDLRYMEGYRAWLPALWARLELENGLAEQLEAIAFLRRLLD